MKNLKCILVLMAMTVVSAACQYIGFIPDPEGGTGGETIIEYYKSGGLDGYERVSVTRDSIHYVFLSVIGEKIEIKKDIKTPDGVWEKLVSRCDMEAFAKIQSGKTTAEVDGTDIYFSIATPAGEISFVNAVVEENYQKLQPFFDVLLTEIRGSLLEEHFCSLVNRVKVHFAKPVIDLFFTDLRLSVDPPYETLTDEQKLTFFINWLKEHDCITDAQILCVSCVETFPAQSEIYITFLKDGQSKTQCIDVLMSEPLCFSGVHEVY